MDSPTLFDRLKSTSTCFVCIYPFNLVSIEPPGFVCRLYLNARQPASSAARGWDVAVSGDLPISNHRCIVNPED